MRNVHEWLHDYGVSHQNPTNKIIHWFCVPLIVLSTIGLISLIPYPEFFNSISPYLNFGSLFLLLAVIYYAILSIPLAIGLAIFSIIVLATLNWMTGLDIALWKQCVGIFVAAWIVQFIGHEIEGKKPSFFEDIQFLMIGPMWLMSFIYKKLGIKF